MKKLASKQYVVVILIVIVFIAILIIVFYLFNQSQTKKNLYKESLGFTNETNKVLGEFERYFNKSQVQDSLKIINNTSLTRSQRYEAAKNLSFYFSTAYSSSHEPELRKYAESIKIYAKENFPEFYKEEFFVIGCADSECGEKPDEELKQIQEEINKIKIPIEYLDTINKNLETAIYIPNERIDEKEFGFSLVIQSLLYQNNSEASQAALLLMDYVSKKYSFEITYPNDEIKKKFGL